MLPFFTRRPYQLKFRLANNASEDYIRYTNISDYEFCVFYLCKKGYGSVDEIESWDTDRFLNACEYEEILSQIEIYKNKEV